MLHVTSVHATEETVLEHIANLSSGSTATRVKNAVLVCLTSAIEKVHVGHDFARASEKLLRRIKREVGAR